MAWTWVRSMAVPLGACGVILLQLLCGHGRVTVEPQECGDTRIIGPQGVLYSSNDSILKMVPCRSSLNTEKLQGPSMNFLSRAVWEHELQETPYTRLRAYENMGSPS